MLLNRDITAHHKRIYFLLTHIANVLYFMRYSVNSIIFRVAHRLLYYVFIEVNFEK